MASRAVDVASSVIPMGTTAKRPWWKGEMAAAALPVVGSIVGGVLGNRQQNNALKAQERARREAMTYQRQRDAARAQASQRAQDIYRSNYGAWLQQFGKGGVKRYGMPAGIDVRTLQRPGAPPNMGQAGPGVAMKSGFSPASSMAMSGRVRDPGMLGRVKRSLGAMAGRY